MTKNSYFQEARSIIFILIILSMSISILFAEVDDTLNVTQKSSDYLISGVSRKQPTEDRKTIFCVFIAHVIVREAEG